MLRQLGWMIAAAGLTAACTADDETPSTPEGSSDTGEVVTSSDTAVVGSESDSGGEDDSTGEAPATETGDPSPMVKACVAQDEGGLVWIDDPDCGTGDGRCTVTATCTFQTETPSTGADDPWSYALQCEGEWNNDAAAKNLTKGVVTVRSTRRLAFPKALLDYHYAEGYEDRNGGSEGAAGDLADGDITLISAGVTTGAIIDGFSISAFAMCLEAPGDNFDEDCRVPMGIAGTSPEGEDVRTDGTDSVLMTHADGEYLVNASGLQRCDAPDEGPAPTTPYAILHNSVLVQ